MSITRPTGEQLQFNSANTGEHILDSYLEAAEKGNRTLAELLGTIFTDAGDVNPDLFQFRTVGGELQVRFGNFDDPEEGWAGTGSFVNSAASYTIQVIVATAGQSVFDLTSFSYIPGVNMLEVYVNGLRLVSGLDYAETSSTRVTTSAPLVAGDEVVFVSLGTSSLTATPAANVGFAQQGAGAIPRNVDLKLRESVSVGDFGATGNGVTDDTAAIQAAVASFSSAGTLVFPAGVYSITDTVALETGLVSLRFESGARILYAGGASKPALVLGKADVDSRHLTFDGLSVTTSVAHGYSDESFVGVRVIRINRSHFRISRIEGFSVGLQLWGSSTQGIAYNTFVLGDHLHARVHIDFNSRIASGFINDNLFIGGRIGNSSAVANTVSSYGVRFRAEPGAYTSNNNNVFLKPCFEMLDGNSGVDRIPIYIDNGGIYNTFRDIRAETGRGPVLYAAGASSAFGNRVEVGYITGPFLTLSPVESGAGAYGNEITSLTQHLPAPRSTWHSGDLVAKAFGTTAANIAVRGCFMASSTGGAPVYANGGAVFRDCISLSVAQGIGVFVDTTQYKSLIVQTDTLRSRTGRIGVVCYNSAGVLLDSAGANHPYAVGQSVGGVAAFGYIYRAGSDGVNRLVFRLHADVASVKVIISGGSSPVDLRSFSITGIGSVVQQRPLHVYSGLSEDPDQIYVGASPSVSRNGGDCARGMTVFSSVAAVGEPTGWVCTTAGHNARLWAASTAYAVGQMVTNDTTRTYVCTTAGTSAASGGPTGTGGAVVDGTAVWSYVGVVAAFAPIKNGSVSVEDFGAVGNGIADDTAAFQAAANTGLPFQLRPGATYLMAGGLTITQNFHLVGNGATVTFTSNSAAFASNAVDAPISSFILEGLTIRTTVAPRLTTTSDLLNVRGAASVRIAGNTLVGGNMRIANVTETGAILNNRVNAVNASGNIGVLYGIHAQLGQRYLIEGNHVSNFSFDGIKCSEPVGAPTTNTPGYYRVIGNHVDDCGDNGIDIYDAGRLSVVVGNTVRGVSSVGIEVKVVGTANANSDKVVISGNVVNTTGALGIQLSGQGYVCTGNVISGAYAEACVRVGQAADNSETAIIRDISIVGNNMENTDTGTCLRIRQNKNNVTVVGNTFVGAGTRLGTGVLVSDAEGAKLTILGNSFRNLFYAFNFQTFATSRLSFIGNFIEACERICQLVGGVAACWVNISGNIAENIAGTLIAGTDNQNYIIRGNSWQKAGPVAQVATVNSVGTGETDLSTYTLQANTLVRDRQGFRITAWGNCANNANAKTLRLKFGSQTIGTLALTVSQAGDWRITAEVYRTGANTQASSVQILNGGAASQVYVTRNSLTQTDTADIVVKTTGQGVANNDIQGLGMLVEPINY
jgi:polygalacturonase